MSNTFDLITNSLVYADGTYFLQINEADGAGSGNVTQLVKVSDPTGTTGSNIELNTLQTLDIAGDTFREVRLDLNEGGGNKTNITLTGFKIYDASDNLLYDLTHSVQMDASLSSGSSDGDVLLYVDDSVFSGLSGTDEIYFYAQFANADGGFEEFYVKDNLAINNNFFTVDGTVFEDTNGDGDNEAGGDPGLDGITVNLRLDDGDGVFETTDDLVISTTTTDINGAYAYTNVLPGEYWVEEIIPAGFVQTPLGSDNYQSVNDVNSTNINFGSFQLGSISGQKFEDLDGDGVKDTGEAGLENWTIFIDANDNGSLDAGEVSTTTDANGDYSFTGLTAGSYTIREVQQAGWVQTTNDPSAINITSGKNETNVDFGNELQQTDLQITKEFTPTFKGTEKIVTPGETATFTLTATNAGLVDADYVLIEDNVDTRFTNLNISNLPVGWINLDNESVDLDPNDGIIDFEGDGDDSTIEILIPTLASGASETVTVTGQVDNTNVLELELFGQLGGDNSALQEYANLSFSGKHYLPFNIDTVSKSSQSSIMEFTYDDIVNTATISTTNSSGVNDSDNSNNSSTDTLEIALAETFGTLGNDEEFKFFGNETFEVDLDYGGSSGGSGGNHSQHLDPDIVGFFESFMFWDNKALLENLSVEINGQEWDYSNDFWNSPLTTQADVDAAKQLVEKAIIEGHTNPDLFDNTVSDVSITNENNDTETITVANAQITTDLGGIGENIVVTSTGVYYADSSGTSNGQQITSGELQDALIALPTLSDLTALKIFIDSNVTSTELDDFGLNAISNKKYLLKELEIVGSSMTFMAENQGAMLDLSLVNVIAPQGADITYSGDNSGDMITGSSIGETVTGNNGTDAIAGGNGNDVLDGGNGQDKLRGDGGDDTLIGGLSSDVLRGSYGEDVLIGGSYDLNTNTLTNDGTSDTYVLEENAVLDTVKGYEDGIDKIGLLGGITFNNLTITSVNSGTDTMISLNSNDLMLLEGINSSNIDSTDFTTNFTTI